MKKFILKSSKFILFPVFIFFIIDTLINIYSFDKGLNSLIDAKISKLPIIEGKMNIVIAGDSRAERQLIPEIIEKKTGFNTINIAVSNGEIISTVTAIKKKYSTSNFIFVISASSWQINDGATSPGYLSEKCFQKATIFEKIKLYKNDVVGFTKIYGRLIGEFTSSISYPNYNYDEEIIKNKGFLGIEGVFEEMETKEEIESYIQRHRHYKNFENNGIRWRVFKESIKELDALESTSIIIQPPLSPYGKSFTKNTIIERAEKEYSQKLNNLSFGFEKIIFYDFYSKDELVIKDSLYYDYFHLNKQGAILYSQKIGDILLENIGL
jgi:hypothetical protein